jgi:hypothetical protein
VFAIVSISSFALAIVPLHSTAPSHGFVHGSTIFKARRDIARKVLAQGAGIRVENAQYALRHCLIRIQTTSHSTTSHDGTGGRTRTSTLVGATGASHCRRWRGRRLVGYIAILLGWGWRGAVGWCDIRSVPVIVAGVTDFGDGITPNHVGRIWSRGHSHSHSAHSSRYWLASHLLSS